MNDAASWSAGATFTQTRAEQGIVLEGRDEEGRRAKNSSGYEPSHSCALADSNLTRMSKLKAMLKRTGAMR